MVECSLPQYQVNHPSLCRRQLSIYQIEIWVKVAAKMRYKLTLLEEVIVGFGLLNNIPGSQIQTKHSRPQRKDFSVFASMR